MALRLHAAEPVSAYGNDHSFWVGVNGLSVGTHNVCVNAINFAG